MVSKIPCIAATETHSRCEWWLHLVRTIVCLCQSLVDGPMLPKTFSAPPHSLQCWLWLIADCRPKNQYGPSSPCFEKSTQAVHLVECNGLCRQLSGGIATQKMLWLTLSTIWRWWERFWQHRQLRPFCPGLFNLCVFWFVSLNASSHPVLDCVQVCLQRRGANLEHILKRA